MKHAKKISKKARVALISSGTITGVLMAVYVVGAVFFSMHFFPNTSLGTQDISMESTKDFADEIGTKAANYSLDIKGEGFALTLDKDDAAIAIDPDQTATEACLNQNYLAWPLEVFVAHDASQVIKATYDEEALANVIGTAVAAFNETSTPSENATIVYDKDADACVVKPEVYGTQIDAVKLQDKAETCMASLIDTCSVTKDEFLLPEILSTDERFPAALEKANSLVAAEIPLTLNGSVAAGTVGKELIASWLTVGEDLMPAVDLEPVQAWADETGAALNTVGTSRTYTRADGKAVTVAGGTFGWAVDAGSLAQTVKDQLDAADFTAIDIPVSQSANVYSGQGKRDWGAYVDIDLTEQKARYYDASDNLLHECGIVSGRPTAGRATPTGVYFLRAKQSPATLTGFKPNGEKDYETKVTYWMPFIRNSIGLHDATWQSSFGGERYLTNGSHGCVNLSSADAQWFYQNLSNGVCVITHN